MDIPNHNNDLPLLDEEAFGDLIEERLEAIKELEDVTRNGLEIRFRVYGRDVVSELGQFYQAYRQYPQQLEAIVQNIESAVQSFAPDRGQQLWDELEDRIYPMFKPATILLEVAERGLPQLVYRPFLADLIICYVIDEPDSIAYVNEDHLKAWGVLESTLYTRALDNLERSTAKPDTLQVTGEGDNRLFIYALQDGYDAARLLLTERNSEWQAHIPGRLILAIPNRDFLIGFSDANNEILERLVLQIMRDHQQLPYPLSDQLFTLIHGRLELYEYDRTSSENLN